ncbi:MAG: hypothetical protein ACMXYG_06375 [Candidatus Woesearchaeota archaeon]
MSFTIPGSMDECLYFTRRTLGNAGKAVAWVEKKDCPECGKAKMGKPVVKGKVKVRATTYECPACGFSVDKKEYESTCEVKIIYTCPECNYEGDAVSPYKRKKWQGVDAFVFECEKCKAKLGITKKMADAKKK